MLTQMTADYGISGITAQQLLAEWEFEANRRGLDQRTAAFWTEGRAWLAGLVAARKSQSG